jgi:hypothetical protein
MLIHSSDVSYYVLREDMTGYLVSDILERLSAVQAGQTQGWEACLFLFVVLSRFVLIQLRRRLKEHFIAFYPSKSRSQWKGRLQRHEALILPMRTSALSSGQISLEDCQLPDMSAYGLPWSTFWVGCVHVCCLPTEPFPRGIRLTLYCSARAPRSTG